MKMEMYYFNPNTYGTEFITMAESPNEALENLKKYLLKESKHGDIEDRWYLNLYNEWKDSTVDNLPYKYTIDEYYEDDVIETEIA